MTYRDMKEQKPKEKQLKTHAIDGLREGSYGGVSALAAVEFVQSPFAVVIKSKLIFYGFSWIISVPIITMIVGAVVKAVRNWIRKNTRIDTRGLI